jgi:hypothetical protein
VLTSGALAQPPVPLRTVDDVLKKQAGPSVPLTPVGEILPPAGGYVEAAPVPTVAENCAPPSFWTSGPRHGSGVFTTGFEYLLWFIDSEDLPLPLVSTNPALAPVVLPANGQASSGTELRFEERPLSGGRFTAGYWLNEDFDPVLRMTPLFRANGVELTAFVLGERSIDFREDFAPTLVRPFFDLNNRRGSGLLVAAPGVASGSVFGSADIDLWGLEANGWSTVYANPPGQTLRIDVMAGIRYLNFDSELSINSQSAYAVVQTIPELVPFAGNRIDVTDSFGTLNEFYGGQVGFALNYITPCFIASTTFKLGLGDTHQQITIAGSQRRTAADGTVTTASAGLLAAASNSGTFDRHRISLVPEVNFKLAFPLGRHFTFFAGYSFLGWSDVVRPGAQIDPTVDITQIPNFPTGGAVPTGLSRPAVPFRDEFLFIHGLNTGVMVVW